MSETDATKDSKQQLKKDRMKDYFLTAAKDIIMQDGVGSITVRSVADNAGYSYATLYNYFEDLNDLLWQTKLSIMWDVFAWMNQTVSQIPQDLSSIKKSYEIYMSYYLEHPNVYFFLFCYQTLPPKTANDMSYDMDFDAAMRDVFIKSALSCGLREEDIALVYKLYVYLVHGLLSMHFSGSMDMTTAAAMEEMGQMIDYIFNRKGL